jgi:hypothetical protein
MISDVDVGDGIYRFGQGENAKIGINASVINTGTLLVGEDSNPVLKAVFDRENTSNNSLILAGWDVTPNSITKGDFTKENSFYMYSTSAKSGSYFGANESKDWMLGIGKHFGVTKNGELYCTGGKIGSIEIINLASQDDAKNAAAEAVKDYAPLTSEGTNFSWKFSPNEGFYMYDGGTSGKEVFKVYKNVDKYEAWIKGHIEADSGRIGPFTIAGTSLTVQSKIQDGDSQAYLSMQYYNYGDTLLYETTLSPRGMRTYNTYRENYSYFYTNYIRMHAQKNS